jgi:hypothetical protein
LESVKSNIIPLQVKPEKRPLLLRHPVYKKRDVVDLFIEAKAYVQGRIPVPNKETAIAILLSRDEAMNARTLRSR